MKFEEYKRKRYNLRLSMFYAEWSGFSNTHRHRTQLRRRIILLKITRQVQKNKSVLIKIKMRQ